MRTLQRFSVIGLFILLLPSLALAQDQAKGKNILNKMSAKYKKYSTMQIAFKVTTEIPSKKKKDTETGSLSIKKNTFKFEMKDQVIYCDGTTIWTHTLEDDQCNISTYTPASLVVNPSNMFTRYEKGYLYAFMGEETYAGKAANLVELTPNDKKVSYFKIKMYISKAGNELLGFKLLMKSGDTYTYDITKLTPNTAMDDSTFVFDKAKHPKTEMNDLRPKKK